jgi:hypothetical protein
LSTDGKGTEIEKYMRKTGRLRRKDEIKKKIKDKWRRN